MCLSVSQPIYLSVSRSSVCLSAHICLSVDLSVYMRALYDKKSTCIWYPFAWLSLSVFLKSALLINKNILIKSSGDLKSGLLIETGPATQSGVKDGPTGHRSISRRPRLNWKLSQCHIDIIYFRYLWLPSHVSNQLNHRQPRGTTNRKPSPHASVAFLRQYRQRVYAHQCAI